MSAPTTPTTEKTYFRASMGLKDVIAPEVERDYASGLVEELRANGNVLEVAPARVTFHLAKEFGFCYGVDKAIEMSYEARRKFPDKRIILLTEVIHNPRVNRRLVDMGIEFLSGQYKGALTFDDIRPTDVVMVPAFGVPTETMARLRAIGAIIVDTTCGSVVAVWKRVEKYAKDGFTSLVHGKYAHEETLATVSQATAHGGHFLVVRNMPQADRVCATIRGELPASALLDDFRPEAYSPGFDPAIHLQRIGVANQTTMLSSESLDIARRVGEAIKARDGIAAPDRNFRSFDTICSATQERQDAIQALVDDRHLDLVLVVGGYNSSNTTHLLEVAQQKCPAYHIEDASEIIDGDTIRHQPLRAPELKTTTGWLPPTGKDGGPLHIGLTAGASTPNKALADAMERIIALRRAPAA